MSKIAEEELNERITSIAFEVIAAVGAAHGMYMDAIQEAKAGHYDVAHDLMKEGQKVFVEGHNIHHDILVMQAQGVKLPMNIYLIHAEDQLMSTENFETVATEMIELYEQLNALKDQR